MTAEHRGWGRGFPVNRAKDMTLVDAGGVRVSVNREIAPIVTYLLEETLRRGYRLRRGECWGYANRPVKGTVNVPSNHSWGLAVDLNAPANPMSDHLVTDMPPWLPALWAAWGFGWGGAYKGRKDAMHYEFTGTPSDAHRLTAKLAAALAGTPAAPVTMEVRPRLNFKVEGTVVDALRAPGGGVWVLTDIGAVYAFECPDIDAPNRHPDYWQPTFRAARFEPLGAGFTVIRDNGARYEYPGP